MSLFILWLEEQNLVHMMRQTRSIRSTLATNTITHLDRMQNLGAIQELERGSGYIWFKMMTERLEGHYELLD